MYVHSCVHTTHYYLSIHLPEALPSYMTNVTLVQSAALPYLFAKVTYHPPPLKPQFVLPKPEYIMLLLSQSVPGKAYRTITVLKNLLVPCKFPQSHAVPNEIRYQTNIEGSCYFHTNSHYTSSSSSTCLVRFGAKKRPLRNLPFMLTDS
jgi:hypothetical protein